MATATTRTCHPSTAHTARVIYIIISYTPLYTLVHTYFELTYSSRTIHTIKLGFDGDDDDDDLPPLDGPDGSGDRYTQHLISTYSIVYSKNMH